MTLPPKNEQPLAPLFTDPGDEQHDLQREAADLLGPDYDLGEWDQ